MRERSTNVYLIRHADAKPEAGLELDDGTTYYDLGLSKRGREQARALARRLRDTVDLTALYSSGTRRAVETAQAIAREFDLDVETDQRLGEVGLAHQTIDHLPLAERAAAVRAQLDHLASVAMRDGSWESLAGTEPGAHVRARMRAAIDRIIVEHPGASVALVSHAGAINAYVAEILEIERDFFFPTGNTSITLVRPRQERRVLVRLNDVAHLERVRA